MAHFSDATLIVTLPDDSLIVGHVTNSEYTGKRLVLDIDVNGTPATAPPLGELLAVEIIASEVSCDAEFGVVTELHGASQGSLARVEIHVRQGTALSGYLNRRDHVRIAPAHDEPIEVSFRAVAGVKIFRALALDVSIYGVSFELSTDDMESLDTSHQLMLALRLPTRPTPLVVMAKVMSQRDCGRKVLVGMEFAHEVSPGTSEPVLRQYVMNRQREILARRSRSA